jgi:hypothetical protein
MATTIVTTISTIPDTPTIPTDMGNGCGTGSDG